MPAVAPAEKQRPRLNRMAFESLMGDENGMPPPPPPPLLRNPDSGKSLDAALAVSHASPCDLVMLELSANTGELVCLGVGPCGCWLLFPLLNRLGGGG